MQYTKLDEQTMSVSDDNGTLLYNVSIPGNIERLQTIEQELVDTEGIILNLQNSKAEVQALLQHAVESGFEV